MSAKMTSEICQRCSFFDTNYGTCRKIRENIRDYPKKFSKCNGVHFSGIDNVNISDVLSDIQNSKKSTKSTKRETNLKKEEFPAIGRMNRARYLMFRVVQLLAMAVGFMIIESIGTYNVLGGLLYVILVVANIGYDVLLGIYRLHDLGRPGDHYLLMLIPFYNIYFSLLLFFKKGEPRKNEYGYDPLLEMSESLS